MKKSNGVYREGSKVFKLFNVLKLHDEISATDLAKELDLDRTNVLWTINGMVSRGLNCEKLSKDKDMYYVLNRSKPHRNPTKKKYKKIPRDTRKVEPGVNIFTKHSGRYYLFELLKKYDAVSSKALCKELKQSTMQLQYLIFGLRERGIELKTTRRTDGTYYNMVDNRVKETSIEPKKETPPPVEPPLEFKSLDGGVLERAYGYMVGQGECIAEDLAQFLNTPEVLAVRIMNEVARKYSKIHIETKSIILKG